MSRIARTAAVVIAAALALAGCAEPEEPASTHGPNGYEQAAQLADGTNIWWDHSDDSGLTDIIAINAAGERVGSCLGRAGLVCNTETEGGSMVLVIGDPAADRGVVHYFGQDIDLVRGEGPAEGAARVFAAQVPAPPADPSAGWNVELFDAGGQSVFTS